MKSHYATISARQPRKVRPQGPPRVVPQVPQAGPDRTGSDAGSRSLETDRSGERVADHLGQGGIRPCAYVHQLSGPPKHQPDRAMAQGDEFAATFPGIPTSQEAILGPSSVGER